ncbi:hypothetical protein ATK30_6872 [Amycolatopsis echigonensis]|uniref:Uncharacterized protein n=1 Tax=Amycolatopsis echigonensis TaxID=2576905 RepID=A0A2N3WPZ4_9PSEU|nr:hypothetical protein [Amycolatopsis niigatensis]PKV95939.1 hypothetical protein ATK30_6872 [Amycolatopsis niigatensis]
MNVGVAIIIFVVVFAIATYINNINKQAKKDAGVMASFADLHLTKTHVIQGDPRTGLKKPVSGLVARVEDSGTINQRLTATRLATMGPFALAAPKKVDNREVYLTIEGIGVSIVRMVPMKKDPTAGSLARSFASMVNTLSKGPAPVGEKVQAFTVTLADAGPEPKTTAALLAQLMPDLSKDELHRLVTHTPAVLEGAVESARVERIRSLLEMFGAKVTATAVGIITTQPPAAPDANPAAS